MFSPEFAQHWPADRPDEPIASASAREDEALSRLQQEALEELVERVNAARSII